MNKTILMGRLTRDPNVTFNEGGEVTSARFSIAISRRFKREGDPEADFFNCSAFGKLAGFVNQYLKKGVKVVVIGRIQNDNYTNKEGQAVYSVNIIAEEIEFAESLQSTQQRSQQVQAPAQQAQTWNRPQQAQMSQNAGGYGGQAAPMPPQNQQAPAQPQAQTWNQPQPQFQYGSAGGYTGQAAPVPPTNQQAKAQQNQQAQPQWSQPQYGAPTGGFTADVDVDDLPFA